LLLDVSAEGKFLNPYLMARPALRTGGRGRLAAAQWALNPQREIVVYRLWSQRADAVRYCALQASTPNTRLAVWRVVKGVDTRRRRWPSGEANRPLI
jgi:hypothetical protein